MTKDNYSQLSPSCDDDRVERTPRHGGFSTQDLDALRAEKAAQTPHPTASYYSHSEQRWIPLPEPSDQPHITVYDGRTTIEPIMTASYIVDTLLADPAALLRLADALEDARFERSHSQRLNAQAAK
jgi:hypothetical protein